MSLNCRVGLILPVSKCDQVKNLYNDFQIEALERTGSADGSDQPMYVYRLYLSESTRLNLSYSLHLL